MTPNEIKEKMRNEPEFTVGALIALYQHQTPEEQSFQTTAFDNNMGFNKVDSKMLTDLSKFYLQKGYLSDKQIAIARQKLMKYAKQLCGINIEPLKIKGKSNNKPPKPKEKLAKKDSDERIRVEFPYDKDIIFAIKDVNGYWFDANSKTWTMPLTITNIDKLLNLGFKLTSELQQWYDQIYSATSDISVPGLDDILRPFQKEAVSYIESRNGRALVADEMGLGKEQPLDCGILTPAGWKLMGEIKVGDLVIGSDGKPTKVKGVFPQGIKDAYRVTFSDGSSTKCGLDHLWNVRDVNRRYRKQEFVTKTTKELLNKGLQYPNGGNKWDIPLSKPIDFKPKALYIHPYMMGVLLGDGYLNGTGISVSNPTYDHDIMDRLEKVKPKDCSIHYHYKDENSCPQHSIVGHYNQHNPVLNKLRKLKLDVKSKHRFIPDKYLTSSIKQRIELLRGLMDTDGSCDERSRTVFHSCNKKLAQDVVNLVRSLGGVSYIRDYGGEYQVNVLVNFCPFHTKRKKNNWKKQTKSIGNSHGQRGKFITNIEFVGKEEQQCISVENKDGLYITDDYIVTHNTIEAIAWIQYRGEEVLPALIVCPANLKLNWVKEINKFTDLGKHVEVLEGMTPYDPKKNIMIINYDILQYWETKLKKIKPKTVIADEIHKAKNRKAKRTKSLTNAARAAKFMIGLTGTPILNQPQEIFQPLKVIKPNLFPNFMNFARRYCNPKHNGFAWDYSGASNTIELNQILTKECFPYYTPICLEKHGTKQIGEVVENGIKDRVLAYDFENAEVQWRQIEAHSKSEGKDRLIRIKHEFGEFTCTPDHPIWTEEKGYIRAAEVTPDLSLLVVQEGEDSSSE